MAIRSSDDISVAATETSDESSTRGSIHRHRSHFRNERLAFLEVPSHSRDLEKDDSSRPPVQLPLHSEEPSRTRVLTLRSEQDDTPAVVLGRRFERTQRGEPGCRSTEVLLDGSVPLGNGNTQPRINAAVTAWDRWYDQNHHHIAMYSRPLRYCAPMLLVTLVVLGTIVWMSVHGFSYAMLMPAASVKASV